MAKTTVSLGDRTVDVTFSLNERKRVESISQVLDTNTGKEVRLAQGNMRGKVTDALNRVLSLSYENVEFDDGEDPDSVRINPVTGDAEFID